MNENDRFERGVAHFNAREFFEAHDVWEEIWLSAPQPEKPFLQGIIQIAAAFHHFQRGNLRGTRSLLAAGIARLGGFQQSHRGIDVERLRAEAQEWADGLAAKAAGTRAFPLIHRRLKEAD